MRAHYYPDTDSLYIDLNEKPSVESREVAPSIVLDYDNAGVVCGIDIDHAGQKHGYLSLEHEGLECYLLSESALAKDWLTPDEDEAWKDL